MGGSGRQTKANFHLERLLGEGGIGKVFLAHRDGQALALKFLHAELKTETLHFFREEVKLLSRLSHPNLIKIFDFFEGDQAETLFEIPSQLKTQVPSQAPCFAMEYVSGMALDQVSKNLSAEQWIDLFIQACHGLHYLHARNILHRDLKPSNLFLTEAGRVKILDFSLSTSSSHASPQGLGTFSYMPPEAFLGDFDPRSDLFSLGTLFYSLLSGAWPYAKPPTPSALQGLLPPKPLREWREDLPEYFCEMIDRMVELSPAKRPASALTLLRYLQQHSEREIQIIQEEEARDILEKVPLVGREEELEILQNGIFKEPVARVFRPADKPSPALRAPSPPRGEGHTIIICGPTGVGRTRLLEEFKWWCLLNQRSYIAIGPAEANSWWRRFSDTDFISFLHSGFKFKSKGPLTLAFTDLQDWPEGAIQQLKIFLGNIHPATSTLNCLLEYNDDLFFFEFPQTKVLHLKDLSPEDSRTLLLQASVGSPVPENISKKMIQTCGGRPLLLLEALKNFYKLGDSEEVNELLKTLPKNLQEALKACLQRLSRAARHWLGLMLVHPLPIASEELLAFWKDGEDSAERALLELDQTNFLAARTPGKPFLELKHPSLKGTLLSAYPPQEIENYHQEWLTHLSSEISESTQENSSCIIRMHHALGAGNVLAQTRWGLEAVKALAAEGQFAKALDWSEQLLPILKDAGERCKLHAYRAPYFYRLGQYEKALEAYQNWYELREDDESRLQKVKFHFYTGFVLFAAKQNDQAREQLEQSLEAGDSRQHEKLRPYHARANNLLAALYEKAGQSELARHCLHQALELGQGDPLLSGETHQRLGELESRSLHLSQALAHFENSARFYSLAKNPQVEAIAHHSLGMLKKDLGDLKNALDELDRAVDLAKAGGEILQWAKYQGNRGLALLESGNYGAALETLQQSENLIKVLGTEEDRSITQMQLASVFLWIGNEDRWRTYINSINSSPLSLNLQAEAAYLKNRYEEAETLWQQMEATATGLNLISARLGVCRTKIHRQTLDAKLADLQNLLVDLSAIPNPLFQIWRQTLELMIRDPSKIVEPDLVELLGGISALENPETRMELHQLLAIFLGRQGFSRLSQAFFAKATQAWHHQFHQLPEEMKMDYEKNRGLKSLEEALAIPNPKPQEQDKTLPTPQASRGQIPESRFRQFCEISRQISQKSDMGEILERVMDAAIELSGAERGFLILKNETSKSGDLEGYEIKTARHLNQENLKGKDTQFSFSAVKEAMAQGAPLLTDNAQEDARLKEAKSVHQYQLKSILVVPLELEGKILGGIYLDHRYQPDCFAKEDITMIAGFASQASLAIQKAQMMEALRKAKDHLEVQVKDQAEQLEVLSGELSQARKNLRYEYSEMIGKSPAMINVFKMLDHVTPTKIPVWIWGESGTGKELIARSLHSNSPRKSEAFVSENCSAIPENLLESELFGHKKGAFTHAESDRVGLFEQADGGTLFLDEVADMSLSMQAKLLRVLQEGEIRPLGTNKKVKINVRLVTASNRDLQQMVKQGKFRQDLFYRINGMTIKLPPLKERKEDIPLLINHMIKKIAKEYELKPSEMTKDAYGILMKQPWPGNIRELEGAVRNLLLFANGKAITRDLIQMHEGIFSSEADVSDEAAPTAPKSLSEEQSHEREVMLQIIQKHHMDKSLVAKELGISLKSVYARMERLGIPKKKNILEKLLTEKN